MCRAYGMIGPVSVIDFLSPVGWSLSFEVVDETGSLHILHFYSGKFQAGGERKVIEAPYERIPLYVRAGAIIPFGDDIQYTDEKPAEHIRLYIYQGADGEFTLYEDEGVNYNYEQGMYAMIPMKYDEATKTLVIGERQGEFPGMLKERTFTVVTVNKEKAQPFDLNAKGVTVKYNGSEQTLKL